MAANKKQQKITYKQFKVALSIVHDYKEQLEEHYKALQKEIDDVQKEIDNTPKFANVTKETKFCDSNLSVRVFNIIRNIFYSFIA